MIRNLRRYGGAILLFFLLASFPSLVRAMAVLFFLALLLAVPLIASATVFSGYLRGRFRRSHFFLSISGEEI